MGAGRTQVIHAGPIDTISVLEAGGPYILLELQPRGFAFLRPEEARELADELYRLADKWPGEAVYDERQLSLEDSSTEK